MNTYLLTGAILAGIGCLWHGILGEIILIRKIDPQKMPSTIIGSSEISSFLLRAVWHVATVWLGMSAIALYLASSGNNVLGTPVLFIASVFLCCFVVFILMAATMPVVFLRLPQGYLMGAIGVLSWLGAG
jgi:hypothetical protein|tara:strand:+ start:1159 stop:1548 length:390 start_codon:yes stop_codon:yes gene_type:complete